MLGALLQHLLEKKIRSPASSHIWENIHASIAPMQTNNRFDPFAPNSKISTPASNKQNKTYPPIFETSTRELTRTPPRASKRLGETLQGKSR